MHVDRGSAELRSMLSVDKQDFYKEEIRKLLLVRGEKPREVKIEQILHDLEALAEIFVKSVSKVKQ